MELLSRLQAEFGEAVSPRPADANDAVDDVQPQAIAAPRDEAAAQELVHFCGRENIAFVPRGGGTKLHIGAPPSRCDLIISTENLTQIFDHDEGNATVQAGAGISLANLDAEMRKLGQFVPLEGKNAATLGGTIATNHFGGSKLKYGAPRDLVTGLHAVLSDGRLVKAGSKVVKNVSGYDLNKLFISSFGNLGLITEVTIRLRSVPECTVICETMGFVSESEDLAWQIMNGPFEPVGLEVEENLWVNVGRVYFEGSKLGVEKQLSKLPALDAQKVPPVFKTPWELRVHLPIQSASLEWRNSIVASDDNHIIWQPILGVVRIYCRTGTPDVAALRNEAEKLGGFLIVERAPIEVKTPDLIWGKPRGDFALMQKLKQSFDAANVCAPGRFIGGL